MEKRSHRSLHIVAVPEKRDLLTRWVCRHLLEGSSADKVVIELHEWAIAQVVRRQVVVGDVLGVEASAERRHRFVARSLQPLAVALHRIARVDGGKGRGNPT